MTVLSANNIAAPTTVDELIADGCAVDLPVTTPNPLWVKSLICGDDTAIILCVNDDYASDRQGTVHQIIMQTEAGVVLPKWIDAKDAFEVSYKGIADIGWDKAGQTVNLHLGKTHLTRMIVVTSDSQLRSRLQSRYNEKCAANVAVLTAAAK